MKKLLLFISLFCSLIGFSQQFNQPSQFNNVCDDNNDGFATFYMQEIAFEILANFNSQDYVVTHHLTQADAVAGINALPNVYTNISNPQLIFARVQTIATGQFQVTTYNLNVNQPPIPENITLTACSINNNGFSIFDLFSVTPQFTQGQNNLQVSYHQTLTDANNASNPIFGNYQNTTPFQDILFVRIENVITGCFSVGQLFLVVIDCQNPNCPTPTNFEVSNITSNSATLSWNGTGNEIGWNLQINGMPIATAVSSPFVLNNLNCNEIYSISLAAICSATEMSNSVETYFTTLQCIQPGQPQSYNDCVETGSQACFDLTQNDVNVLGTLNPAEYLVSYYMDQACTIPAVSPFCMSQGFQMIFSRVVNNTNPSENYVNAFSLNVFDFQYANSLQAMVQCDDNNDQQVVFDLTTSQVQINTTNALSYYANSTDAQNQQNAITNPTSFAVSTLNNNQFSIFIRETIENACDSIYPMQIHATNNCNNASNCIQANSLCNALGIPFNNTTNTTVNEQGANYGCLITHPNPTWFYLPVSQTGTINLMVQQNSNINFTSQPQDVDYIVYGPFTSPTTPCYSQLTPNYIVSCSYSSAAIEYPTIPNAQVGQYYLMMVTNFSNLQGYIKIDQLGSTTAQIDCTGMRLNAFLDSNNNGTQDSGEVNFPLGQFHYEVNNNGTIHNITAPTGIYNIYDTNSSNSYNLNYTVDAAYTSMYNVTTTSYSNVNIIVGGGMVTYNFPVTVVQPYNDLSVSIVPVNTPRPGFEYQNKLVYSNHGNQTITSGTVNFVKDAAVTISSVSQLGTTNNPTGFSYTFTNLLPFETRMIDVSLQVPAPPTVNAGQVLTNSASIIPLSGDVVPENNDFSLSQTVINSYDPNDKMESHGERILFSSFTSNDYLYYTIRFENTGSASAINVRVNDVLNNQLDASSVRMVNASHSYVLDRIGNNLTWKFDNIQLPVSVANTNIGKGYITFKVKPNAGYAVGDIIPNAASIYFDYNPAIITNTFNTEFVATLAVNEFENTDFIFYPNPTSGLVTVSLKDSSNSIKTIAVYDVLGKLIFTKDSSNTSEIINLTNVNTGIYFIEVTTDSNKKVIKKLIVK